MNPQSILIEQARFLRAGSVEAKLVQRSPGFRDDWVSEAERLVLGFGPRPSGMACPEAIFAQPLGDGQVAVVQVADVTRESREGGDLAFHFLVLGSRDYQLLADPFHLARAFPADWSHTGPLEMVSLPRQPLPTRTVAQVQAVLRRVKASALKEDEDPESPDFERTADNSESPALLGGVQVLVDGGQLVFQRPAPDPGLIEGLWTLLPNAHRTQLWPATFAFDNALGFDLLVVPHYHPKEYEGYTSEDQAAEYPAGHYELNLQTAAESGDQRQLETLFNRRTAGETIRLGLIIVVALTFILFVPRILDWIEGPRPPIPPRERIAAAAGIVGVGDPWTALAMRAYGDHLFLKKAPTPP